MFPSYSLMLFGWSKCYANEAQCYLNMRQWDNAIYVATAVSTAVHYACRWCKTGIHFIVVPTICFALLPFALLPTLCFSLLLSALLPTLFALFLLFGMLASGQLLFMRWNGFLGRLYLDARVSSGVVLQQLTVACCRRCCFATRLTLKRSTGEHR